jgi:hypothetical protein
MEKLLKIMKDLGVNYSKDYLGYKVEFKKVFVNALQQKGVLEVSKDNEILPIEFLDKEIIALIVIDIKKAIRFRLEEILNGV